MRVLSSLLVAISAVGSVQGDVSIAESAANPVRRVVTLLENMAKKVAEEGEKEEELYKKFMCYCSSTGGELTASIAEANTKVPQLETSIEESKENLANTKLDLKNAQDGRKEAKEALASATAVREKDNKAFLEEESELSTYVEGLTKAIAAIEKGMTGSFLQGAAAMQTFRRAVEASSATEYDKQTVSEFLQGAISQGYVPKSGEVTGILKQMLEDFSSSLKAVQEAEAKAVATFEALTVAKSKQVDVLTAEIESKTVRIGELQVSIVGMEQDLKATQGSLAEDLKFAEQIKKDCDTKTGEWEKRKKLRAEELVAIHETIKILNDDDALELFKKTLPSPSLLQAQASTRTLRAKAMAIVDAARAGRRPSQRSRLDFLALALQGRDFSFAKVIAMIDNMVKLLADEAAEDEDKKEYCGQSLDTAEDKAKALAQKIDDKEVAIADAKETMEVLVKEIDSLQKGIKDLDKSVEAATEQRKEENDEYKELVSSNSAAKELLNFAKNRLNKFYNPKLYKPPAKEELSQQERIAQNMGGAAAVQLDGPASLVQVSQHDAPEPPPETWGAYSKSGQESTGVIQMIDLLVKDLDKEITEAEVEEKNSQKEYEQMMSDSATKRAADMKAVGEKTRQKALKEESVQVDTGALKTAEKELMITKQYEMNLHAECDWLIQFFDVRKEARAQEVDNLKAAKAVLSGADYSLLQGSSAGSPSTVSSRRLRH
jgi:hypothetical protein